MCRFHQLQLKFADGATVVVDGQNPIPEVFLSDSLDDFANRLTTTVACNVIEIDFGSTSSFFEYARLGCIPGEFVQPRFLLNVVEKSFRCKCNCNLPRPAC